MTKDLKNPPKHPKHLYVLFEDGEPQIFFEGELTEQANYEDQAVIVYAPVEWANIRLSTKTVFSARETLEGKG